MRLHTQNNHVFYNKTQRRGHSDIQPPDFCPKTYEFITWKSLHDQDENMDLELQLKVAQLWRYERGHKLICEQHNTINLDIWTEHSAEELTSVILILY